MVRRLAMYDEDIVGERGVAEESWGEIAAVERAQKEYGHAVDHKAFPSLAHCHVFIFEGSNSHSIGFAPRAERFVRAVAFPHPVQPISLIRLKLPF
jgi:hypothetical protein